MRIFSLVAALVFCFSLSLSAQHFDIRAYGGVNFLELTSDKGSSLIDGVLHNHSTRGRPGGQFGVAVTFGDQFYVQPGFQWSTLTTEVISENSVTAETLEDEATLSVISVPLKLGFRLIPPDTENLFNVRIFGGFDGHHVTSVNHSINDRNIDNDYDTDDYTNLILNADFGLGIDLFIFYIDAGYQLGITPVHAGGDDAKANAFYSNLGLRISL
jgi:hypothetical protein